VIPAERVLEFLHPLPVAALWGVGERTEETLRRLGLMTVRDLADAPIGLLRSAVGEAVAAHLHELSWGRDPRKVHPEQAEKSIGAETTFDVDVSEPGAIRRTLLALSNKTAGRVRHAGMVGRTIGLKIRFSDFRTISRSRTLPVATDVSREIFETAWSLFEALRASERIRLVGVRLEGLLAADGTPRQMSLGEREAGWREADQAADAAALRFGRDMIGPASLLGRTLRADGNGAAPGELRERHLRHRTPDTDRHPERVKRSFEDHEEPA
jgi:DNA polymerase-4